MSDTQYLETLYPGYGQQFAMDTVLFRAPTEHQELIIFDNERFGRVMALDGIIQTTEADEFIYHEMLTHVPILAHGSAKRVLIIGGGDGGMLREVIKHQAVERVVQVEIDHTVIEMCKQHLPNHSQGAFDDPRVEIVIDDGKAFVLGCQEQFDVIISDCTDPIGPGEALFESDFYKGCKQCLTEGGIFVAQNGVPFMQQGEAETTYQRLAPYFADRHFYVAAVPTYIGGAMSFAWASDNAAARQVDVALLSQRFAAAKLDTRYYNPAIHVGSFALPQYLVDRLAKVS
ncbi:spermidine synthase [Ferrimonas sediminum]|uniref:Polyamine aminopropyltransferase n=1 Tax=Ferrimonas sediminum TaxID=718193 RepID=A0A1G8T5W0_9GAMM|nr:polyamine aminopropyltransferase [Ferrimonas sediminum]SDJ36751.1 spermidine synthase [Ferrimonas sediminum]